MDRAARPEVAGNGRGGAKADPTRAPRAHGDWRGRMSNVALPALLKIGEAADLLRTTPTACTRWWHARSSPASRASVVASSSAPPARETGSTRSLRLTPHTPRTTRWRSRRAEGPNHLAQYHTMNRPARVQHIPSGFGDRDRHQGLAWHVLVHPGGDLSREAGPASA
jgi:hypothetical protein